MRIPRLQWCFITALLTRAPPLSANFLSSFYFKCFCIFFFFFLARVDKHYRNLIKLELYLHELLWRKIQVIYYFHKLFNNPNILGMS